MCEDFFRECPEVRQNTTGFLQWEYQRLRDLVGTPNSTYYYKLYTKNDGHLRSIPANFSAVASGVPGVVNNWVQDATTGTIWLVHARNNTQLFLSHSVRG